MRFYEGKTQMEVADELAISQAQISRIEKSALQNMRTYLRAWMYAVYQIHTVQCNHTLKAGLEIQGPLLMIAGYKKHLFDYIISG